MSEQMSQEQHKARHVELHQELDELVADFIGSTGYLPSKTTLMEFMRWSHEQTIQPNLQPGKPDEDAADVIGKYVLIEKHIRTLKGGKKRRSYHEADGLGVARALARQYAASRAEDFLLVQIVEEISKPETKADTEELE